MGGGGGMMGSGLAMGAAFDILKVNVGRKTTARPVLGPLPPLSVRYDASNVPNYAAPRPFTLDMSMMTWTINGRVFEMMEVAEDEMVHVHDTMAWEWINNTPIPHPMHMHNIQFQVVERTASSASSYTTINQGWWILAGRIPSGLAGRACQDCHDVWSAYGHVHVSLSYS
jgi:FtsP/CotA-like multicopper oxidase with cupredoxin domain